MAKSVPSLSGAKDLQDVVRILNTLEQYLNTLSIATVLNLPVIPTPVSPKEGDIWMETTGLFYYRGGVIGPL